ncbi:hypothetical protein C2U72_18620 [Prosthecomicrobium hirschii]|uniref:hypothetical protein n=1 Tax=Prosthecodimorpha hirschii TaxID=665126 RepID=UPI00112D26B5|nr:hypothetical protein [Prosthecomicrobium hirschii]TPQ49416.1 hypothetical protein C2U72_18620 [Prosthecomicrobium hirschii]
MMLALSFIALAMIGEVNIVGRLTGAEVILALCACIALVRCPRSSGEIARFYTFASLWLLAAVMADIYNESEFNDFSRGWAKIGFLIVNFTALRWLIGKDRDRAVALVFLLSIAMAARLALGVAGDVDNNLGEDVFGNAWKFGYGTLVSMSALLVSAWLLHSSWSRPVAVSIPFGAAAVALLLNARNLTGITALAALTSLLTAGRRRTLTLPHLLAIGATAALAGLLIVNAYQYAASEGLLGHDAQDKYRAQGEADVGLLVGGRSELLASVPAIIDSPLLGHGSWARDIKYALLYLTEREKAGLAVTGLISDLIPTHSHLLGAWVEHGFLGAVFWIWALFVTGKGLITAIQKPTPLTGFIVFIGIGLLWDIPFSPFGLERRVLVPAMLYLMILVAEQPLRLHSPRAQE